MSDFGKVLEEWERQGRRAAPPDGGKNDDEESARPLTRAQIAALPVEAVLDLHGMTAQEARDVLDAFFRDASDRRLRKVLLIHGKGLHSEEEPVLGKTVRRFLETCPRAGKFGPADKKTGGSGAVWVLVKGRNQRSR